MQETKSDTNFEAKEALKSSSRQDMIQKAFTMYMQQEARKESLKAPHKDKVKKARRAKNKVAKASRKKNR